MKLRIRLAVAATVLLVPSTALAADSPIAGCPASKLLLSRAAAVTAIDERIVADESELVPIVAGVDKNGDGFLCVKRFEPNRGSDKFFGFENDVVTLLLDNHSVGRTPD